MKVSQSGILLLDKQEGPSSAAVVEEAKRILGARKVGHLGTLDPFASGLLPLAVNEGTKIAQVLMNTKKSYVGVAVLGKETDTMDRTGTLLRKRSVPNLDDEEIQALRRKFSGSVSQIPPMFSAVRQRGVRLYRLARQGQSVRRDPRNITIEELRLWRLNSAELGFYVTCSKGTYIRALAADMGTYLGCGAYLKTLRRVACGPFSLEEASSLSEIESLRDQGQLPLIGMSRALQHLRAVVLESEILERVRKGQQSLLQSIGPPRGGERELRLTDARDELVALLAWDDCRKQWRLARVFEPRLEKPKDTYAYRNP